MEQRLEKTEKNTEKKMKPIKSQVIVITGASSGIGLATAKIAAKRGARVVLASRNTEDLEKIVKILKSHGGEAIAVTADVTKIQDLEKVGAVALEKYGRVDTWINNAGIAIYGKLMNVPVDEEKLVFETNFWGVRNGSRVAIPLLKESKGILINVGSNVSQRAIPLQGIYSASKHAVRAFTDALRMELERDRVPVQVSLIHPIGVDTPYTEHALNRLENGEPSLPGAVYHPNVVAQAILKCAEHPERDVYVGGPSKILQVLGVLMPKFMDLMMEKNLFEGQIQGSTTPHTWENEGVLHKPAREGKVTGGHKGRVLKTGIPTQSESVLPMLSEGVKRLAEVGSQYTKAKMEPFMKDLMKDLKKEWKDFAGVKRL